MSLSIVPFAAMFSTLGLFRNVDCPEQPHCSLSHCIFAHPIPSISPGHTKHEAEKTRASKRLRVNEDGDSVDRLAHIPEDLTTNSDSGKSIVDEATATTLSNGKKREISPPPLREKSKAKTQTNGTFRASANSDKNPTKGQLSNVEWVDSSPQASVPVSLNPKILPKPPAPHSTRVQLINLIHEQMVRLNEEIRKDADLSGSGALLSDQELVLEALRDEEKTATESPAVYLNVVKLRIMKLKKMKLEDWKTERLKRAAERAPFQMSKSYNLKPKSVETGLTKPEEIDFLSRLLAKQESLTKHGYVPKPPVEEELVKAREGVQAAQGWEVCDRCKTRFQVFPGRREEDGALTSGGQCTYHPAKPRRPKQEDKADRNNKEPFFACCSENVGFSSGCTKADNHVFKISDAKRLALIMPFKDTPPKLITPGPRRALCLDCEMGYTTMGLELVRLTATSWPDGEELLDILVRPLGEILDLNSRFSGVFSDDYANAIPYEDGNPLHKSKIKGETEKSRMLLVASPIIARDLLFELLTPETPIIGHALDNDLNVTRIMHPSIVDTVLLYPHPRGLPIRHGLKTLMKSHLDRDIQMGGAEGHDSREDARAAGDLVRLKIATMWRAMKRDGWTIQEGKILPPMPDE